MRLHSCSTYANNGDPVCETAAHLRDDPLAGYTFRNLCGFVVTVTIYLRRTQRIQIGQLIETKAKVTRNTSRLVFHWNGQVGRISLRTRSQNCWPMQIFECNYVEHKWHVPQRTHPSNWSDERQKEKSATKQTDLGHGAPFSLSLRPIT